MKLYFRGIILYEFKNLPIKKAAFTTAVLSGILQLDLGQILMSLFIGTILAYLMYYSQNILAPIIGSIIFGVASIIFALSFFILMKMFITYNKNTVFIFQK